jgi:hypothetical protein
MTTTQKQQFWQKHLALWRDSGLSQAAYCRQHELEQNSLSYHKHKQSTDLVPASPSGFITLPLPQTPAVLESLTLHFNSGISLSGIATNNILLVKQLTDILS